MLRALAIPLSWTDLVKRTAREVVAGNCLGLAAELAYYFFLALFPALLFLVALVSFLPVTGLMDAITNMIGRVAPVEVLAIIQAQVIAIAHSKDGGLLTLGMLGTIWSTSSGVTAIIDTLNQAYDIQEGRSWWRVRLLSFVLTVVLAIFIVFSFALVMVGPTLGAKVAEWLNLGTAFTWTWMIVQWPLVFGLVMFAIGVIYYYAPDAKQQLIWIWPGAVLATVLWVVISLAFKYYVQHFTSYNTTYGAIGGAIVALLWFYVSALAVLVGAELNAEIEHASPYGKDPGEKAPGEKALVAAAERHAGEYDSAGTLAPALARSNCDVDVDLPRAMPSPARPRWRASDLVVGGVVLIEAAALMYVRLRRVRNS